ncbi:hypothetical protein L6R49_24220 [Myxococcota bacterium]|nr:hypothetical protein [Myxococcota bacterium]
MSLTMLLALALPGLAFAEDDCSPDTYENAIYDDGVCKLFGPEEFCADIYDGDCPTYDEITDGVAGSNSEMGIEYYFNDAGEMIGAYEWIFEGTGWCCEGQVGEAMLFGIEPPTCTPVPDEEPKDRRWSCAHLQPQTHGLLLLAVALIAARRRRQP